MTESIRYGTNQGDSEPLVAVIYFALVRAVIDRVLDRLTNPYTVRKLAGFKCQSEPTGGCRHRLQPHYTITDTLRVVGGMKALDGEDVP